MCKEEAKLWTELQNASFAMTELGLYMDTHCGEPGAMSMYRQYQARRQNAIEALNRQYGPVTSNDVNDPVNWTWTCNAWPWEGEV